MMESNIKQSNEHDCVVEVLDRFLTVSVKSVKLTVHNLIFKL